MDSDPDDTEYQSGRLLIAMPGIGDPRFERAVILCCMHSPERAMGIAVNRPLGGITLPELLDRLGVEARAPAPDQPVLAGGPVERERGFVLHTDDYAAPDSTVNVASGIALTATREVLEAMTDRSRRPRHATLALGCASWSPGQLDREILENVWLSCEPDEALVFDGDYDTKWLRALAKLGVRPDQLSGQAGHA